MHAYVSMYQAEHTFHTFIAIKISSSRTQAATAERLAPVTTRGPFRSFEHNQNKVDVTVKNVYIACVVCLCVCVCVCVCNWWVNNTMFATAHTGTLNELCPTNLSNYPTGLRKSSS